MLILYSPLPLANTGTATYLRALLQELDARFGFPIRNEVIIAVDAACNEDQFTQTNGCGWTVKDFRSFDRGEDDICVYFLASNPYHYYCYEQLATHTRGMCVSVIHDLTAGFFVREMKEFVGSPYVSLLDLAFSSSLDVRGAALGRDFDSIHEIARYFVAAQGVTLAKSDVVVTHSYYAKSKLVFESNLAESIENKIVVCKHPKPTSVGEARSCPRGELSARPFSVGSFGYYSNTKRFYSVVRAWVSFLKRQPEAQGGRLILGSEIPEKEKKRLLYLCAPYCEKTIEFPGFLPEEKLHTYMRGLDLLVTLWFPTCGETSGLVAHALVYDIPIAISEFAAFREEPAAFRISVDPCEEVEQLANAFGTAFECWKSNGRLANITPDWVGPKGDLASYLGHLLNTKLTIPERQKDADATFDF